MSASINVGLYGRGNEAFRENCREGRQLFELSDDWLRVGRSRRRRPVNVNETIDESVFERWRADASYRLRNLVGWPIGST